MIDYLSSRCAPQSEARIASLAKKRAVNFMPERPKLPEKAKRRIPARRTLSVFPGVLFVGSFLFLKISTAGGEHESNFACPNPDLQEGVCRTADRYEQMIEDEHTLLDVFGEVAKQFLTQRVIPPTEAGCRWDWRHARCEPFCDCSFQPKWGDFHLGRCCRQRKQYYNVDGSTREIWWNGRETCHIVPNTPYSKASYGLITLFRSAADKVRHGIASVASNFAVKGRFGKARANVCSEWKDRAETEGRTLSEFQRRLCSGKVPIASHSSMPDTADLSRAMDEEPRYFVETVDNSTPADIDGDATPDDEISTTSDEEMSEEERISIVAEMTAFVGADEKMEHEAEEGSLSASNEGSEADDLVTYVED